MSSPSPAIAREEVWIPSAAGPLEGALSYPEEAGDAAGVLILSPHPRYGGDLENNVTRALADRLAARGFAALRFNYRGVGRSGGPFRDALESFRWWSEVLEKDAYGPVLEDARAALAWLSSQARPVHGAGYSFGAVLALRLAGEGLLASVAALGMAVGEYRLDFLERVEVPVLAIHSDRDFATPLPLLREKLALLGGPGRLEVMEGTDHFFRGKEAEAAEMVAERFLEEGRGGDHSR